MTEKLTFQKEQKGGWDYILLKNAITDGIEDTLKQLSKAASSKCVFDFSQVTLINSCGIAEWVNFIRPFSVERKVLFENVPPHVLRIVNMIKSFCGEAKIRSVWLDFICEECEYEQALEFTAGKNMPATSNIQLRFRCPKCEGPMAPSITEEEAFAFLNSVEK